MSNHLIATSSRRMKCFIHRRVLRQVLQRVAICLATQVCLGAALAVSSNAMAQAKDYSRPERGLVRVFDEQDCLFNCGDGWKNDTNEDGRYTWNESYLMMGYVAMYEATGDVYYLRKLVDHADAVLDNRDDARGVFDYTTWQCRKSAPGWRRKIEIDEEHLDVDGDSDPDYHCRVVNDGMIIYPMVRFAAIVNNTPSLQSVRAWDDVTFAQKADEYITKAIETVDYHNDEVAEGSNCTGGQWEDGPGSGRGHYNYQRVPSGHPNYGLIGVNLPWNQENAMGRALAMIYDYDDVANAAYGDQASRLAKLFKDYLCTLGQDPNKRYNFLYHDPGFGDKECQQGCGDDISHGAIGADFAAVVATTPGVTGFADVAMGRFANTYTEAIVRGDGLVWDTVNGCDTSSDRSRASGRWLNLTSWDDDQDIFFSVQAVYDDAFIPSTDYNSGSRILVIANLAHWEDWLKLYAVRTGPGSGYNWADVTAADVDGDGTDEIVAVGNPALAQPVIVYSFDFDEGDLDLFPGGGYYPPDGENWAAASNMDVDGDQDDELILLCNDCTAEGKARIHFYDYANGQFDEIGDLGFGGSATLWVGMGVGVFEAGKGPWVAVIRDNSDQLKLYSFTYSGGEVTGATLEGARGVDGGQWTDLDVGDFDGDGLAEIVIVGNDVATNNDKPVVIVYRWDAMSNQIVEIDRDTGWGISSDIRAVTAADLDGNGVDEMYVARNSNGAVFRRELDNGVIIGTGNAQPFGASQDWGGLGAGRFGGPDRVEFALGLNNRNGDVHLYGTDYNCPADLDYDGTVDVPDLLILLGISQGDCPVRGSCAGGSENCDPPDPQPCPGDINGDNVVDCQDVNALLGAWGPCL